MSKSKMSPRLVISRIALFAVVGSFLLIFMAAGTSAAGFSFMDPVMAFFGLPGSNAGAATANRLAQPNGLNGGASQGASVLPKTVKGKDGDVIVGQSYHNDTSPPLRDMRQLPIRPHLAEDRSAVEVNRNPEILNEHKDVFDPIVQSVLFPDAMPTPIRNMDGIPFPGVSCNCAPPDTNGEVGATQYVQMVNEGYQVFNKSTGAS